jgi:hypothetical protein
LGCAKKDGHMGLVKTRRLAAMQKQQRAKAGMRIRALPNVPSRFQTARGQDEVWGRCAIDNKTLELRLKVPQ